MADLGPDELSSAELRIQLIGQFQVLRGPGTTPLRLPAGKATTVARLLVVRRGSFVSVDTIVETLWEDEPPPGAAQNVASLVSRLRRALGPDAISGGRAGYRFEAARTVVDVEVAQRLVAEAEAQLRSGRPALAASAATQARAILERGGFLEDEPYALWAEEGRREAERLVRQARWAAWSAALALGDHAGALDVATRALETNSLDEEAHRARMEALYRRGNAAAALAAYEQLRSSLVDELGVDPSPQSEALYLAILRAEPLAEPSAAEHVEPSPSHQGAEDGLVGREQELAALTDRWTAAASGRPGVIVAAGAAGSGKTSICRELVRQARSTGAAVLWSTCHEAERSLFLEPLLDALRAHLGAIPPARVRTLAGEWTGTLGELMPDLRSMLAVEHYERATPEIEHRRSLEAVGGVIRNIARDQPLLVVLDDVHHAGESTLDTVHFILERLVSEPVLFVVSTASEAAPHVLKVLGREAYLVSLRPLSVPAVQRLARRLGAGDVNVLELHARTGGNTQFVVEALRSAAEGATATELPESLQAAVLERVERAGHDVEDLLRVAAIAGSTFELDFTADLAGISEEDAAERAGRALAAGLLDTDDARFRFAGSVIRDALYETTPTPIRTSRHRRAASKLADRPEAAAAHHAAAGDYERAHEAWAAAAERAIRSFAIRDGERLLREAVSTAERAGDRRALARTRLRRGQLREELADYEGAQQDHTAALSIARELGDDALEAQALERLGWTAYYGRDSAVASELAARATELAESAAAAPAALPSALVLVGRIRHWAGDVEGAAEAYEEALAREPDPATSASALSCLGALLEHGDRFVEARRTLDLASAEAARAGAFRPLLRTLFFAALARGNLGDFGGALRALERKRRLLDEYEVHFYRARTDTLLSWVWREVGQLGRAADVAEQAVEEAREVRAGSLQVEQELHGLLGAAECALLGGDQDRAAELVAEAEPLLSGWLPFRWRAELTFRHVRCRLVPKDAEELLELARQRGSRKYEALALAHLDRRPEAATVAASTGSDLLVAEVAPAAQAGQAFDRLAAALPLELREGFATKGRLAGLLAARP
jgi:DNA-binding SARP family transcriptional activator